jgi:rubrerythrin
LQAAFAGESQARNKYHTTPQKQKKMVFVQIGNLFEETANNEKDNTQKYGSNCFTVEKVADTIRI